MRAGKTSGNAGHFLGTVVYIANNDDHNAPLLVIDGQQRITTLTLLLLALAKTVGTREPYDGFSARKIYNYYFVNEYEEGDRHNRLLLTKTDRDTLLALVNDTPLPVHGLNRILENYNYFIGKLARVNAEELQFLCRGIAKLLIVIVAMTHSNPLPKEWQKTLGPDWQRIQKTWLHTAGNLTLTGYNCEYSNRPFEEKRDMHGGFSESPLHLNGGPGELSQWTEQTIKTRAQKLADQAVDIWRAREISEETLKRFKPQKSFLKPYTIADHPFLQNGMTKELFEAFRKEMLGLDDNVREEFLKLYIAYKAETDFVDVVPQAKQLNLTLTST